MVVNEETRTDEGLRSPASFCAPFLVFLIAFSVSIREYHRICHYNTAISINFHYNSSSSSSSYHYYYDFSTGFLSALFCIMEILLFFQEHWYLPFSFP